MDTTAACQTCDVARQLRDERTSVVVAAFGLAVALAGYVKTRRAVAAARAEADAVAEAEAVTRAAAAAPTD